MNVTAALSDNGEREAAIPLLAAVEQDLDEIGRLSIEPRARLQLVVAKVSEGAFDGARALALQMRPNKVADIQRGTALRAVALGQTRKEGAAVALPWALGLKDEEDRAYALLGVGQALTGSENVRLPYNVIQIH